MKMAEFEIVIIHLKVSCTGLDTLNNWLKVFQSERRRSQVVRANQLWCRKSPAGRKRETGFAIRDD